MVWIELATIVVLFGAMALVFGWLELREKRRIHEHVELLLLANELRPTPAPEAEGKLHEILTPERGILTRR